MRCFSPLSILCGLILCSTAVSLFAVSSRPMHSTRGECRAPSTGNRKRNAGIQALRDTVEALAAQIHDLQKHPLVAPLPGLPKPGLNLNKRSHALRMHRRGEAPNRSPPRSNCRARRWIFS